MAEDLDIRITKVGTVRQLLCWDKLHKFNRLSKILMEEPPNLPQIVNEIAKWGSMYSFLWDECIVPLDDIMVIKSLDEPAAKAAPRHYAENPPELFQFKKSTKQMLDEGYDTDFWRWQDEYARGFGFRELGIALANTNEWFLRVAMDNLLIRAHAEDAGII